MGKSYDHLPGNLIPWIIDQKVFWVATAPLAEDGHVNVSPKGYERTFHIMIDTEDGETIDSHNIPEGSDFNFKKATSRAVWYEDLTGSGAETIAHARENGRITVMFSAFEGPANIVRLFGTAKVYEFGTPEYEELLPLEKRQPGSRSIIWVDFHRVGTACGFSIPFYTIAAALEQEDYDHYVSCTAELEKSDAAEPAATELPGKGLKNYWKLSNNKSIDGVPAIQYAYASKQPLGDWTVKGADFRVPDDESIPPKDQAVTKDPTAVVGRGPFEDFGKHFAGFGAGVMFTILLYRLAQSIHWAH
ncbi:hypothetical protein D9611_009203 [Ephemerocybe angulata]|uniref:Pyridoxamine 5'-phosphate oxidase putative domain-containing protein n=1 Tax=Ephemerocybe angulata TaxID=980116 RepID=A0A8H5FK55_9AGAR|nr:hypothetical protein D9611_009203 [Tulosesus angulatus]